MPIDFPALHGNHNIVFFQRHTIKYPEYVACRSLPKFDFLSPPIDNICAIGLMIIRRVRECDCQNCCAVLCTTVVHSETYTHEQFLKFMFMFSVTVALLFVFAILFLCCLLLLGLVFQR